METNNSRKIKLTLDSDAFNAFKNDFNMMLRKLLLTMEQQESEEGKLNVAMTVKLEKNKARDYQANGHDAMRDIISPSFSHKVGIALSFKDEKTGILKGDYEMHWDKELQAYVIEDVNNGQTSFFDEDQSRKDGEEAADDAEEVNETENEETLALPGTASEEAEGVQNVDGFTEEPEDEYDDEYEQRETWKDMLRHQDHKVNILENHGMYSVRDAETNGIILTALNEKSKDLAEALKPHVGHDAICIGGYDQDSIQLRRLSIKCQQCDECLWYIDNPDPVVDEPEPEPDMEEGYEYEQTEK